jgi:hypothetical protein
MSTGRFFADKVSSIVAMARNIGARNVRINRCGGTFGQTDLYVNSSVKKREHDLVAVYQN